MMLLVDGEPTGFKDSVSELNLEEMRERGIESMLALVHLAKNGGVNCCGHHWTFENSRTVDASLVEATCL